MLTDDLAQFWCTYQEDARYDILILETGSPAFEIQFCVVFVEITGIAFAEF